VLEPVTDVLPVTVVADEVGSAELGQVVADGLHGAAGTLGEHARRRRPAVIQQNN